MAAEELLALLSPQDLAQFQGSVIQSSPSYMGSQAVQAWQPDMSTWSPMAQGAGSFGRSFLSSILGNMARQDAADQLNKVVSVLPQLQQDPLNTAAPEGVNNDVFAPLRGSAYINKARIDQRRAEKSEDLQSDLFLKMFGKKAEIMGEQAAYRGLSDNGSAAGDLMNPIEKEKRGIEKAAQDALKTTPMVTNFQDLKSNFESMRENYKFNTKPATLAFIASFARVQDPGSTVKEGEIKNAENTQSFFSGLGYNLKSLLDGTQTISPETKQQMLQASAAKYNTFGKEFQNYLTQQQDFVGRLGGRKENVFAPTTFEPFDFEGWRGSATQEVPGATVESKLQAIRDELKAGASSERVIELRNAARSLVSPPTSTSGVPKG